MEDHHSKTAGTDEELVARAQAGDRSALGSLVERHQAIVYRVLLGILEDPELAADASQETFLKAVRGLHSFRGDAKFRTWLLTIASNEAKGALRRQGVRKERPLEEAPDVGSCDSDALDRVGALEEEKRVRDLLSNLPKKQRLAVQLRTQEGLSFREVGEIIGSSEGAARVNYHHGIRRLREMLE